MHELLAVHFQELEFASEGLLSDENMQVLG
jgi:hypothetical protein